MDRSPATQNPFTNLSWTYIVLCILKQTFPKHFLKLWFVFNLERYPLFLKKKTSIDTMGNAVWIFDSHFIYEKSKMFWKCETLAWISLTHQFCFHFLIILLSWSFQFSSVEIKDHPASCSYLYWLLFAGRQKNRFPLINLTTPGLAPFTSRKELCVSNNCVSNQKLQSKSHILCTGLVGIVQQEVDIPPIISSRKRGFTGRAQ